MKKRNYLLAMIGALSMMQCITGYAGTWKQEDGTWTYQKDNGAYAEYEWIQDPSDHAWYYCGRWGRMETNTVVDGYYIGADGRMLSQEDKQNPLYGEKVCGTCFMRVNSYKDCGTYYEAKVTLFDNSYYTNDELNYVVGDKIWIEARGAYGTVTFASIGTGGDVMVEAKCGRDLYRFTKDSALYFPYDDQQQVLERKIKDTVVKIPKNVTVVPVLTGKDDYLIEVTLDKFLNNDWSRLVPVFDGDTVRIFYDHYINYAA